MDHNPPSTPNATILPLIFCLESENKIKTFTLIKTFNTWLRKQKILSGGDNFLIFNVVFKAVIMYKHYYGEQNLLYMAR